MSFHKVNYPLQHVHNMWSGHFVITERLNVERAKSNAISVFRQFATKHNVHITLVIHPRKEMDRVPLGISSVFGTAKATQEADNVLILQKPDVAMSDGRRFVCVCVCVDVSGCVNV